MACELGCRGASESSDAAVGIADAGADSSGSATDGSGTKEDVNG